MSRLVVALGGNALGPDPQDPTNPVDLGRLTRAAEVVAELAKDHGLVVTHGNGPQVGLLAARSGGRRGSRVEGLDVFGAESQGMIGYLLEREVRSRIVERPLVTLLTQVVVDLDDSSAARPTKPIGTIVERRDAERCEREFGWTMAPVDGGWRRVVPSPRPVEILELEAVDLLVAAGHVVICGGGGGIPVIVGERGELTGVEAVVDKDLTTALLATRIEADMLLLLTNADAIYSDWPQRSERVQRIAVSELRAMTLSEGSMGPKAEAAAAFVEATGKEAAIGSLDDASAVLEGSMGTRVVPDPH